MVMKFFFAINALAFLLLPTDVMSQGGEKLFDQFKNADVAVFQGAFVAQDLAIESYQDTGSAQGLNVIKDYTAGGKVVQAAIVEADLLFDLSNGNDAVQGVNVFQGDSKDKISQVAIVDGTVTMKSRHNSGGIQGINVITGGQCN
jgi:hypothetical protein